MDYYFQDQVRWTFGFDNPNKAAALLASCLPLLWILYRLAWKPGRLWLRWIAVPLTGAALCAGWWLLFKTYSRGGIVAAGVAFGYLLWRSWRIDKREWLTIRCGVALLLTVIVGALFVSTAAARRSAQWIEKREGSVENRLDLWKGGLRMAAQIPQGVGRGNSGEAYMQWFQPIESTPRYRTLVNSYLTFLVEQGLAVFALVIFAATALWNGTNRSEGSGASLVAVAGLRASIVAFLVAGFFSTTMEDRWLWIVPGLSLAGLLSFAAKGITKTRFRVAGAWATAVTIALCAGVFLSGHALSRREMLEVSRVGESIRISPKSETPRRHLAVLVDRNVLGADYGKLLRRLAESEGASIVVNGNPSDASECDILLASGDSVQKLGLNAAPKLVLVAPSACDPVLARQLLHHNAGVTILQPAFDEDGRVDFWETQTRQLKEAQKVHCEVLDNVGTHVEWAWDQVIACIHRLK